MPLQGGLSCIQYVIPHNLHNQENYVNLHMIYCEIDIYSDNQKFQILINEILKHDLKKKKLVTSHIFAV